MKRSKGFTLVELLAVIAILAIIVVIAYPMITGVIKESRTKAFNLSADSLEKATKTYIASEGISVADGSTLTITYTEIKAAGYMEDIKDPKNNNECTGSKIYVTNTGGKYTYKTGIVCDNYLDIDEYNVITNYDFSDGDTGWTPNAATSSVSDNILTLTSTTDHVWPQVRYDVPIAVTQDHVWYTWLRVQNTNAESLWLSVQIDGTDAGDHIDMDVVNPPTIGEIYTLSGKGKEDATFEGNIKYKIANEYASATAGNITKIYGDTGVYLIDLTEIYGCDDVGTPCPTTAELDAIFENMK